MVIMKKIEQKNIFISSSCIYPNVYSVFNAEERIKHLRNTVNSCKRIPNSINIISEGSNVSDEVKNIFSDTLFLTYETNETVKWAINSKQIGTCFLWISALESIKVPADSNIFFLSGRYELAKEFDENEFDSDYVFKKHWYAEGRGGWYGTQLYKISGKKVEDYYYILQECINRILQGTAQDIECAIYQSLSERNIKPKELAMVNCEGLLGPSGKIETH
jgi:hypothetical protein